MKKLLLCLLVVFCLCGCSFDVQENLTIKNVTNVEQIICVCNNRDGSVIETLSIPANSEKTLFTTNWARIEIKTVPSFGEKFVKYTRSENTWIVDYAEKTTYTVQSELDYDITLENFNIVNGQKSNPRYSVFIPNNSKLNTATIEVYPDWLGGIWDLAERNITSIYDYNDKMFQSVVIDDKTYYYEIVISGNNIYIRNR